MIRLKIVVFSALTILLLQACQMTNPTMRRFTFAAFNVQDDSTQFQSINPDFHPILRKSGVVNYNYCTIDSIALLVLDMEDSFNLEETRLLFGSLSEKYAELSIISEIIDGKYQLLDHIYKMEQKKVYKPEEGQLITMHKKEFARFILTLEIINDAELAEEYVAVHSIGKAWPEITQNMKTVGIHEMELYLLGYRAFLIMDTKPNFDWDVDGEKWGELPRENEWQAHVAKFQKTDPESKAAEKWKTMQVISMYP